MSKIDEILNNTPLDVKIKVSNEMYSIYLIHELGFREEKYWTEED